MKKLSFKWQIKYLCLSIGLAFVNVQIAQVAIAEEIDTESVLFDRSALGDITQKGGAQRLKGNQVDALKQEMENTNIKNVILFIGDGMGDSEITAARNYAEGAGGYFKGIDALPFTGQYTHYALNRDTKLPDYVTDSAASATAWSSGVKTFNGALGIDVHAVPHVTLLELAKQAGIATGNVSTAEIQDATPAALYAHIPHRKCYGPTSTTDLCGSFALEKGGLGSITEQLIEARADVTLGGGAASFLEVARAGNWKDKTLMQQAKARGYTIVHNAEELGRITNANQKAPIIGLFSSGNMPVRWMGPKASYQGHKQPAVECEVNAARTSTVPTLAQMTEKAIELLRVQKAGFFLQVEGASIDKQDHAANPCGQFGETVDLDEAVQVGLAFAKEHGDTLIIVTADHAHSSQIIPNNADAPGLTQTLITKDGSLMSISYGNSETDSQNHTGAQLRIAAYGPKAANVTGLLDQTDLFFIISDALSLPVK